MTQHFELVTRLPDHALENTTAITNVALGASLIEKQFTLNCNGGGLDDSFSLEHKELATLCRNTKPAWQALGKVTTVASPVNKGMCNTGARYILSRI